MRGFRTLPTALSDTVSAMCRTGEEIARRGWAEMNAGNMSIDVTAAIGAEHSAPPGRSIQFAIDTQGCAGHSYLVTCAGSRFRDMTDDQAAAIMLIHIPPALDRYDVLWGGTGVHRTATSELAVHLMIQALSARDKTGNAVLHTHPTHVIALTHIASLCNCADLDRLLRSMYPQVSIAVPEGIGFVPYREPGSRDLAAATLVAVDKHRLVVWEKHGCVAIGDTIGQAFDLVDVCNKAAEIYFLCKGTGHDVQGLSEQELRRLQNKYPQK